MANIKVDPIDEKLFYSLTSEEMAQISGGFWRQVIKEIVKSETFTQSVNFVKDFSVGFYDGFKKAWNETKCTC